MAGTVTDDGWAFVTRYLEEGLLDLPSSSSRLVDPAVASLCVAWLHGLLNGRTPQPEQTEVVVTLLRERGSIRGRVGGATRAALQRKARIPGDVMPDLLLGFADAGDLRNVLALLRPVAWARPRRLVETALRLEQMAGSSLERATKIAPAMAHLLTRMPASERDRADRFDGTVLLGAVVRHLAQDFDEGVLFQAGGGRSRHCWMPTRALPGRRLCSRTPAGSTHPAGCRSPPPTRPVQPTRSRRPCRTASLSVRPCAAKRTASRPSGFRPRAASPVSTGHQRPRLARSCRSSAPSWGDGRRHRSHSRVRCRGAGAARAGPVDAASRC